MTKPTAQENGDFILGLLAKRGLLEKVMDRAIELGVRAPWGTNWARAYSDGHNNRGLGGRRLDHYASAYADICEEAGGVELALDAFWFQWDGGHAFEGVPPEHWYVAGSFISST